MAKGTVYRVVYEVRNHGAIGIFWPQVFYVSAASPVTALTLTRLRYADMYEF